MTDEDRIDAVVIGAGPVGLFAVFQLGLFGIKCRLIDSLDRPGGQCAELYADKPIYDVPGWPSITGQGLVDQLLAQIAPFAPSFCLSRLATGVELLDDGRFRVAIDDGEAIEAAVVIIAAGWGAFASGLGEEKGRMVKPNPFIGWGLELKDGQILVDSEKFQTSTPGVFCIGDANWYPGKLKLILSGFHEAALMAQAARRIIRPAERAPFQYTTSSSELQKKLGIV